MLPINSIIQQPLVTPNLGDITILICIENNNPTSKNTDNNYILNADDYIPLENEPTPAINENHISREVIESEKNNENLNANNQDNKDKDLNAIPMNK